MSDENSVISAQVEGAQESDFATLKMAHPLNKKDKERLGIDPEANVVTGSTVRVLKSHARTLIGAGYAQVDPEDHDAVRKVLRGENAEASTAAEAPDAGEGTAQDAKPAEQEALPQAASADPAAPTPVAAEGEAAAPAKAPARRGASQG